MHAVKLLIHCAFKSWNELVKLRELNKFHYHKQKKKFDIAQAETPRVSERIIHNTAQSCQGIAWVLQRHKPNQTSTLQIKYLI